MQLTYCVTHHNASCTPLHFLTIFSSKLLVDMRLRPSYTRPSQKLLMPSCNLPHNAPWSAQSLNLTTPAVASCCRPHLLSEVTITHPYAMYPDGSQCPEDSNSTECLLRTFLEFLKIQQEADDTDIDWDPISFAFTLLIGLLAIFFALATVLQAIFAAGKGRRRTSHLAIGQWSQKTTRRWEWSEMNFHFTASTPILREASLSFMPSQSGTTEDHRFDEQDGEKHTDEEPAHKLVDSTDSSHVALRSENRGLWAYIRKFTSNLNPNQSRRPFAAWLGFFEEVGLHQLDCQGWGDSVREVSADYLPDDLVAAPAYAEIGAIVAAAAISGIQKFDVDQQNYPILLGRGFQVDFRLHPALGVVGAYSRYETRGKQPSSLVLEELRSAMRCGRGIIEAKRIMDFATSSTRRQVIERWNMTSKLLAVRPKPSTSRSIFVLKLDTMSQLYLPLIAGFSAQTPARIPALFPTTTIGGSLPLTVLALSGKYWSEARLDKFSQFDFLKWPKSHVTPIWHDFDWIHSRNTRMSSDITFHYFQLSPNVDVAELEMKLETQLATSQKAAGMHSYAEESVSAIGEAKAPELDPASTPKPVLAPEEAELPISDSGKGDKEPKTPYAALNRTEASDGHCIVLHMCLKLLWRPAELEEWFFDISPNIQRSLRCIVLEQLKEVDQWLREKHADVARRSIVLCNTSIILLQAEQLIEDPSLPISRPGTTPGDIERCWEQLEENTARGLHFKTLQVLCHLIDGLDQKQHEARRLESLVDVHEAWPSSRLWDRLSALVVYHSKENTHWPLWNRFQEEKHNQTSRDIDDVIIYRCLMVILLFRTAADSSKILESGLWNKVVPII